MEPVNATGTATTWEHFPHGADVGVRGVGPTLESAFEQAARALTGVLVDPGSVEADTWIDVSCQAPDPETLLVDWLNALVFEMAHRRMVFGAFEVRIENGRLRARAGGQAIGALEQEPAVEVRGATYTALRVARTQDGWLAQCVVDV